jgi:hypothetical protein
VLVTFEEPVLSVYVEAASTDVLVALKKPVLSVDVEAASTDVLVALEEPVLSAEVEAAGTGVLVAFEEPVLMARVEFESEVAATLLEVVLFWKKIPPLEVVVVAYEGVAVADGSEDTVVEYTAERAVPVANAGREDP